MDEQFVPKLEVQPSETSQYAPATHHQTVSDTDDKDTDTTCRVHSVVIKTEPHVSPVSFEHEEEMNTEGYEHKETKCRVHSVVIKTESHDSPASFEHEEEMNTEGYEHKETKYEFLTEDDTSGLYLSGAEPADDSFAVFMEEKKTVSVGSYVEASTSTDVGRSLGSAVVESVSGRESDRKTGLPERSATQSRSISADMQSVFGKGSLLHGRQDFLESSSKWKSETEPLVHDEKPETLNCGGQAQNCNGPQQTLMHGELPDSASTCTNIVIDRLFWCRHCLAAFVRYPNLKSHVQAVHSTAVKNEPQDPSDGTTMPNTMCDSRGDVPSNTEQHQIENLYKSTLHPTAVKNEPQDPSEGTTKPYIMCDSRGDVPSNTEQQQIENLYKSLLSSTQRRSQGEIKMLNGKYRVQCEKCPATFRDKHGLRVHMWIHEGVKPYQCDQCSKRFTTKSHLTKHVKTVHWELFGIKEVIRKDFQCPGCPRAFPSRSQLRNHLKRHAGIGKKHVCTVCEKAFYSPSAMRTHMRTHTGEKPFQCPHCPAAFSISTNMKRHVQTHAKEGRKEASTVDSSSEKSADC